MIIEAILLGTMTVTSYRATPAQTKPECKSNHECQTSIGENVSELGVAVSPDLLASGRVHYRDVVYIPGVGYRIVFDTTNRRLRNTVDVFVYEKNEEKRFGVRHLKVWLIQSPKTEIAAKEK
jgi:3D (Asp-Asp-Asp) domain-containing protein